MIHNLKEYYTYSVKDKNLLIYSNNDFSKYDTTLNEFHSHRSINITQLSIDKLGAYIVTHSIDTLLIDLTVDAKNICDVLDTLNQKINLILYLRMDCEEPYPKLINMCEAIIAEPFNDDVLMYKFFTMLNYSCAIGAMNNSASSMSNSLDIDKENLEDYLDTYEGQILFLSEKLQDTVAKLDSGELNDELLQQIAIEIDEVASVFSNHYYTKKVTPIFIELSNYLKKLDIKQINIKDIEGFEYLSRIIEDINLYVVEYFVDRVFTDVYVFEDSLKNSIQFMQDRLSDKEDDLSELEFF